MVSPPRYHAISRTLPWGVPAAMAMKKTAHAPAAALRISARGLQQSLLVQPQLDDLLVERAPPDTERFRDCIHATLVRDDRLGDQFPFERRDGGAKRVRHIVVHRVAAQCLRDRPAAAPRRQN